MASEIPPEVRSLARLRYAFRKFFSAGDEAAREIGLTPQQHQLLLGTAGFTGRGWATVGELAEFMQIRHHSVVGLIDRVEAAELVERRPNPENRRQIEVHLTPAGLEAVRALHLHHRKDVFSLRRMLNVHVVEIGGELVFREKPKKQAKPQKR